MSLRPMPLTLLTDRFGRRHNNLRISVTDRCNLRCTYCMPEEASFLESSQLLGFDEIADFVRSAVPLGIDKVRLTGLKAENKVYRHYTGYPGGLRAEEFTKRFQRKPESVVQEAIEGMLPKTKMGRAMAKKLKVYKGDKHPHAAQKPEALSLA